MEIKSRFKIGILEALWKIFTSLDRKNKNKIFLIIICVLLSALFDVISIQSIVPLVSIVSGSQYYDNNIFLRTLTSFFPDGESSFILIYASIIFFVSLFLSAISKLGQVFMLSSFTASTGIYFHRKIYNYIFDQSYSYFADSNSSEFLALTNRHIDSGVDVLKSLMSFLTGLFISSAILLGLLITNFRVTFNILFFITFIYIVIILGLFKKLQIYGSNMDSEIQNNIKLVQESIGSIREIILDKSQNYFIKKLVKSVEIIKINNVKLELISSFPRYLIEVVGICSIILFGILLNNSSNQIVDTLPLIASITFGFQKLLPIVQNIYMAWAAIKSKKYCLNYLLEYLKKDYITQKKVVKKLSFKKSIELKNVDFYYASSPIKALDNVNLEIKKGESVGIIGKTGSGKSTMADIIMGLIKPTSGRIFIDGIDINSSINNVLEWQNNISHVPQEIFIADNEIIQNIAIGIEKNEINYFDVNQAIKLAQLNEFINIKNDGYNSKIGERGIKISGGQKQRIGIARALYKKSELLILDEATSALDNKTERKIMENILNTCKDMTLIIIAHRESTLLNCDKIIKFNKGKIEAVGRPSELLKNFNFKNAN